MSRDTDLNNTIQSLATRYFMDDLASVSIPSSRIANILESWSQGKKISTYSIDFLTKSNLRSLAEFMKGELTEPDFLVLAAQEQAARALDKEKQKQAEERRIEALRAQYAQTELRLKAERLKRESDPKFIARKNNQKLREKYDINWFLERTDLSFVMVALNKLERSVRLTPEEIIQLRHRRLITDAILHAHHRLEASYYLNEFKRIGDPWSLVNASGHLRKCSASREALEQLSKIESQKLNDFKLQSAICTTKGGAHRDLGSFTEALELANKAHQLTPKDYRPCTLIGALHIGLGNTILGHDWYIKAKQLGAPDKGIESDIWSALKKMPQDLRKKTIQELIKLDSNHYAWLKEKYVKGFNEPQAHKKTFHSHK